MPPQLSEEEENPILQASKVLFHSKYLPPAGTVPAAFLNSEHLAAGKEISAIWKGEGPRAVIQALR